MSTPRVVVGVPLFRHADYLPQALETLLGQTLREVAFVLCDDRSPDDSVAVAARYAQSDPRIHLEINERRLGLVANWWRTFELARRLHPDAEYFVWGSDHDAWHPRFLTEVVAALDARPGAVLAFPRNVRVDADGSVLRKPWTDRGTDGLQEPVARVRAACDRMVPGDMVYGVVRAETMARTRFRPVLVPDRLLLSELAMLGEFVEVPQVLWHRRFKHPVTAARQRASLFGSRAPWWTRLPWWVPHAACLTASALKGPAFPGLSRGRRLLLGAVVVRKEAAMHLRGQVSFTANWLTHELDRPRNRIVGAVLRAAQLLLRRRPVKEP